MKKVGYQGMENSNSERAAKKMMSQINIDYYELIPLISSEKVVGSLKRNEIDFGVVATKNSIGGIVAETLEAIKNEDLEHVCSEIMHINHSVFKKNGEIKNEDISFVISHEQALKQCRMNIDKTFINSQVESIEDTAIGAKYLAEGKYSDDTAVICNKSAGEKYGLHLVREGFQDDSNNRTEFRMLKTYDTNDEDEPTLIDKISYHLFNEKGLGNLTKVLIVVTIFLSFYMRELFDWSPGDAALTTGTIMAGIILFLTSNKLRYQFQYRKLRGYWKYYAIPESISENHEQRFETPRVVEIEEVDGDLTLKGWLCDNDSVPLFQSYQVMISNFGKRSGNLVYWYTTPNSSARNFNLNGIVTLSWKSQYTASKVNVMSGWYMGKTTKDTGNIKYKRITKFEYNSLLKSDYL